MLKSLYENDKFQEFEIHHCFIGGARNADELYDILSQSVREHHASILLIHTGREFYRLIDIFPNALQKLTSHFAGLKIGIQSREKLSEKILRMVSDDEDIREIEKKIFQIKR
jgi:hypothetical protein